MNESMKDWMVGWCIGLMKEWVRVGGLESEWKGRLA